MSRTTRLVSFLGLGPKPVVPHYEVVCYELDGVQAPPSPLFMRAVCDLYQASGDPVGSLLVLGTDKVEERWLGGLRDASLGSGRPLEGGVLPDYLERTGVFWRLPNGATPEERWTLFERLVSALSPVAIPELGEEAPPSQILIDITHGYRAQPLLGLAAVGFVLSEWARLQIAEPPALRVLYGAYEAGPRKPATSPDAAAAAALPPALPPVAPVWDLTEFVTAQRWNAALDALLRYGRADDLEQLMRIERNRDIATLRAAGVDGEALRAGDLPGRLGTAARKFADDMALLRLRDLFTLSAPGLLRVLDEPGMVGLLTRLPPLRSTMALLRGRVQPLCAADVVGPGGLRAMAELVTVYGTIQRFAEQAVVLREAVVTAFGLATFGEPGPEPGCKGCKDHRKDIEGRLGALVDPHSSPPVTTLSEREKACLDAARRVHPPRNDIEHGGLNDQPSLAGKLRLKLLQLGPLLGQLAETTVAGSAAVAATVPATPLFFNLSDQPLETWSPEQLAAAKNLGLGEPVDLPGGMPSVPADADEQEVERLAAAIVARAGTGIRGALVAGEPTLTVALLALLQPAGVRCFAAITAPRVPRPTGTADTSREESQSCFVRWREYQEV